MEPETPRRRGRPSSRPGNTLGKYLRDQREGRGMTVRDLAVAVGLPSSSASYISQLEAGLKAPNAELAEKLEQVFRDPQGIFRLWAKTGRRSDPSAAAVARRQLARLLGDPSLANDPHFTHPAMARIEAARESLLARRRVVTEIGVWRSEARAREADELARQARLEAERLVERARYEADQARRRHASEEPEVPREAVDPEAAERRAQAEAVLASAEGVSRLREGFSRDAMPVRIPIVPEGADPEDERLALNPRLERWEDRGLRLDAEAVSALRLVRPFAWQLSEEGVHRVRTLLSPGDYVVITRDQGPVVPHEVYAVRHERRIVLSLVMWNGAELLLLPDVGRSDFAVVRVGSERALPKHIVGHVATVVRGLEAQARQP